MRALSYLPILAALLCAGTGAVRADEPLRVGLEGRWQVTEEGGKDVTGALPATVPGCVHTDLLAAGKLPDLFYRDNESKVQWVSAATWVYTGKFDAPAELLSHDHVELSCDGLDTLATIRINGKEIGTADNMFRPWKFDVRGVLKHTGNTIEIAFAPPGPFLKAHENDPAYPGLGANKTAMLRKEPCNFGWDWGPKLTTCGIWKKIGLVGWNEARLSDVLIHQDLHAADHAFLDIDIAAQTDGKVGLKSETTVTFNGSVVGHAVQPLRQADGVGRTTIRIENPQRWWPAGMGAQNLYQVKVALRGGDGNVLDETTRQIGLRTIELIPKTDTQPLGISVNGRPFFAKGANWIPPDVFASRVTPDVLSRYMHDAVRANMNILRFWGGGYYEEDGLYDLCDKLGILVWLDFKFASSSYPSYDPAFRANVDEEIAENVRRLRDHPSIAVWCGNNEVKLSYFVADRGGFGKVSYDDYDWFFTDFIGGELHQIAPQAVFTPGSPEAGDQHFWGVWHGNQPYEAYEQQHGLMTEFGFQSFPEPRTMDGFTTPDDRKSVTTPVMSAHQKSGGAKGNEKIVRMIPLYFHPPRDFDSTMWLSQISQAYGITRAVEFWRRDWPNSTGSIIWQYNDCWLGPTWSMVDYLGHWKALMYRVRDAYAPLLVSAVPDADGTTKVYVSSDRMDACDADVTWWLTDASGKQVSDDTLRLHVPAGTSNTVAATLSLKDQISQHGADNLILWLELSQNGQPVSKNMVTFVKPKFLKLVDPEIQAGTNGGGDTYQVTLNAQHAALWTWLDVQDADATYSDNFVDLRPGDPVTIQVKLARPLTADEFGRRLRVRSLFDTYDPNAPAPIAVQAPDGTLTAPASLADLTGTTAGLDNNSPPNVAGWEDKGDVVAWRIHVDKPGTYSVATMTSCPNGEEGSTYTVSVGDQSVPGTVAATGSFDKYQNTTLGTVQIPQAGDTTLVVRATSKPHRFVMNLKSVTLTAGS
jgi:beta-mannosidase